MKRRSFLKVAGTLSLSGVSLPEEVLAGLHAHRQTAPANQSSSAGPWALANREQKIEFAKEEGRLRFQSFVRDEKGDWLAGSLPANRLVVGPSFGLELNSGQSAKAGPASVLQFEGTGHARQANGQPLTYSWVCEVKASKDLPWFHFRTVLRLPQPLRLEPGVRVEPQVIFWLSSTSTLMEGQALSWRRVLLSQPTRNSLGAAGNDLPAVYLLDATRGVETMMYFDMSDMGWMSLDNVPRFLAYRCATVSVLERQATQRLGIGLIASQATGDTLPAGEVRFTYWLLQRSYPGLITEQEAVTRWMEALLPLFEEKLTWPKCATNWKEYAAGTVRDLQQKDVALITVNGHRGLRAYVLATSELWKEAGNNFELMTIADVLWPSLLYLKVQPDSPYQQVVNDLLETMPHFYHADTQSISNDLIGSDNEVADSWYPFENSLIKYPTIGMLSGSKTLTDNFLSAFNTAIKMAHRYNYLFPIYYRTDNLRQQGAGTNYAVGGLYAWGALIAHKLTGDGRYREEAHKALEVLYTVRASSLFHEPQELSFGALAAAELGMQDVARYLLHEQLRMFYWYSDASQKTHDICGMVQAAASILYPAFKENVESILPWTGIMKRGVMIDALLRFMDQQRRNNFYFFESCHGISGKRSLLPFIPYENLGTLELGGQTGVVGKEIYGSGEVLWLYLMFEALGKTSDRELMLVNLDLLDVSDPDKFPPREVNFILFNPTDSTRSTGVSIPVAQGGPAKLTVGGEPAPESISVPGGGYLRLKAEY
jgi:hypothetical protein